VNYIANPRVGASIVTILNISRPVVDSKNNILFAISHFGNHIDPIYVFGQYAALNSNANNVLVKIDSLGQIKKFRDLGAGNASKSDITDLAITTSDEPLLINKKSVINNDGLTKDYWSNNNFNYCKVYDTDFILKRVVKLGNQNIASYTVDKENKLVTINSISLTSSGSIGGNENVYIDSTNTVSIRFHLKVIFYFP